MNFQKLNVGECGQDSPVVQLATRATRDLARQESIGVPHTSDENVMGPQSFNVNEIMPQIQGDQSRGAAILDSQHYHQIMQSNQQPILNSINEPLEYPYDEQFSELNFDIMPKYGYHWVPEYPPPECEHNPNRVRLYFENLERAQNDYEEAKKIQELVDNGDKDIEQSSTKISEDELERVSGVQKTSNYLHYGGLSVEDVKGVTDLGIEFTETQNFYNFVESYVLKRNDQKYDRSSLHITTFDKSTNSHPILIVQNDSIRTAKRITMDSEHGMEMFEMPLKYDNDNNCDLNFTQLCEDLVRNEQYLDAIKVLKFVISLNSDYFDVLLLTDLYMHEHCYYQACQTLYTWLKNSRAYGDIVPPTVLFASMDDKDCGIIEKKQLKDLQKMFMKATQREPILESRDFPDVHAALAKLCQMDGDYKKAMEYLLCIYKTSELLHEKDSWSAYFRKSFCEILLQGDTSVLTLDHVNNKFNKEDINIEFVTKIGLEYLLRKCYRTAYLHLFRVVRVLIEQGYKEPRDTLLANSWARLRLCFELMAAEDLCEAVDQRDLEKVTRIMV